MYTDMDQWIDIRRKVLVEGISRREIIRQTGIHWSTLQKILSHSEPPGYRRSRPAKKSKLEVTCHIWPNFAPDPLYGNKIAFDYCGQTVSWFFQPHWNIDKVTRYVYEVVANQSKFHTGSFGAPFIGIYGKPQYKKCQKTPERVRQVIRAIKASGAKGLQMAELGNILSDPKLAEVVSQELNGSWQKK